MECKRGRIEGKEREDTRERGRGGGRGKKSEKEKVPQCDTEDVTETHSVNDEDVKDARAR